METPKIKNDEQLSVTMDRLREFREALMNVMRHGKSGINNQLNTIFIESMHSQIESLEKEVREYLNDKTNNDVNETNETNEK